MLCALHQNAFFFRFFNERVECRKLCAILCGLRIFRFERFIFGRRIFYDFFDLFFQGLKLSLTSPCDSRNLDRDEEEKKNPGFPLN